MDFSKFEQLESIATIFSWKDVSPLHWRPGRPIRPDQRAHRRGGRRVRQRQREGEAGGGLRALALGAKPGVDLEEREDSVVSGPKVVPGGGEGGGRGGSRNGGDGGRGGGEQHLCMERRAYIGAGINNSYYSYSSSRCYNRAGGYSGYCSKDNNSSNYYNHSSSNFSSSNNNKNNNSSSYGNNHKGGRTGPDPGGHWTKVASAETAGEGQRSAKVARDERERSPDGEPSLPPSHLLPPPLWSRRGIYEGGRPLLPVRAGVHGHGRRVRRLHIFLRRGLGAGGILGNTAGGYKICSNYSISPKISLSVL